ncbi:MAG: TrmB family transcriptional regulator sugar-binding domain-containing protein, partial [Methanomassiliicoccales archaeon]|nr:TrmB family transcriptional regulator sugar-binding domain-containing protein [Methanomassiliicoccales archaeon]
VSVRGRRRIDDSLISIKGIVTDVKASPDVVNFTVESEGQKFVVGGYNSMVEDIEAEIIVLESAK